MAMLALAKLGETIAEICTISGTAGLSYGVLHEGQVLHTGNNGYRTATSKTRYLLHPSQGMQ